MRIFICFSLLLISWMTFSQNHNFKNADGKVIWEKTYPTFQKDIISLLVKNNKKINSYADPSKGAVNNATCSCELNGFMNYKTFDFLFEITETESNYTVLVYAITFEIETELDVASENMPLENMILNYRRNNFLKSERNQTNLECLNLFISKIFELPFLN